MESGAEEWRLEWEKLPGMEERFSPVGVTRNNQGHLFICDQNDNQCIQMFRAADGQYMGRVPVDVGFCPREVRWSEKLSTMIVAHDWGYAEFIKIQSREK